MVTPGSKVLSKMLDRLLAGLMSGPNMNCRPHNSRQRVDLTSLNKLKDVEPAEVLSALLGPEKSAKVVARVKPNKRSSAEKAREGTDASSPQKQPEKQPDKQPEKQSQDKAWIEQTALLNKLRLMAGDARTYENDTGVHALSIGFPLLSLPPGSFAAANRNSSKRILAPIAFIPVNLSLKAGAAPSLEIACRGEGADRVSPNIALFSWIEQQTGKALNAESFSDGEGNEPWREIDELVRHVAEAMRITAPTFPIPPIETAEAETAEAEPGEAETGEARTAPPKNEPVTHAPQPTELTTIKHPPEANETSAETELSQPDSISPWSDTTASADEIVQSPFSDSPPDSAPIPSVPAPEVLPLALEPAPAGDDTSDRPSILMSAVLGLFPSAHQGLVRDTHAMVDEAHPIPGPIQSFLTSGLDFDTPTAPADVAEVAPASTPAAARPISDQRLAAEADPCQARAVGLARHAAGLVIHGPPGTGKSQTITNIISDHLARGQRVLLVCDKRTALDVVANRLDHLGLGRLCGIVHDPQKDQRDLYRSIHLQLDELPQAKTYPRAEASLQKITAEMQQIHEELTAFHNALMDPSEQGGPSFHELMGRWMATSAPEAVKLDEQKVQAIQLDHLDARQSVLLEMFQRADAVEYHKNIWAKCAGISLADYLTRQMDALRGLMARLVKSADDADATADARILPFDDQHPLPQQAQARTELAEQLTELLPRVFEAGLLDWATRDHSALDTLRARMESLAGDIKTFRGVPLDAELVPFLQPLPTIVQLKRDSLALQQYLQVAGKFSALFAFAVKSDAARVLKQFALPLTAGNANRLQTFFSSVQARLALSTLLNESLAPDEKIEIYLQTASAWLAVLKRIASDPCLSGVGTRLAQVAKSIGENSATKNESTPEEDFLTGLRLSAARSQAIVQLQETLESAGLFSSIWQTEFGAFLRGGKLARETATALADQLDTLEGVLRVAAAWQSMPEELLPAIAQLLSQKASAQEAIQAIQYGVLTAEITRRLRNAPVLLASDAHRIESSFNRYRELEAQSKLLTQQAIIHLWTTRQGERLLAATGSRLNPEGGAIRRRFISRGENGKRLRPAIAMGQAEEAGDPLFDLLPVWMASPETVAQIFPRKALFDVVIFDEASQCRLEEALPVLTRGHRIVIAGDPHQLPPTRFFESGLVQSEDEDLETDQQLFESQQAQVEDLLAAALNLPIQQCYLDVHYRSRNADLIEFSNRNFYSARLQAIPAHPSRQAEFSPIVLYRADGKYIKRQNLAEADRVVHIVRELLMRETPPSIGIACLNLPQRDLIVEKLEELAGEDARFAKRLEQAHTRQGQGSFEGLFVKNLENVQGDERDDIIISTTYGPDESGKFYRRFGPLGMTGGGRRLNVLVTRARSCVHLVTSIPAQAYQNLPPVPPGQAATGAWLLFAYLKYAQDLAGLYEKAGTALITASPEDLVATEGTHPSIFSQQLGDRLSQTGLRSDLNWGNEGFNIDLALRDPTAKGGVSIGLLCDGCRYAGTDDRVEWDIFRTDILARAGWTLKRIWSPHYFRDAQGTLKEIAKAAAKK